MTDAFIFDAVRTPRGRGRPDGSLHSITPIQLAAQTLAAVRDRNNLDTRLVDDVVLGCVTPIGEQGANIARVAALVAGFDESVPGKQLNRFCASGLESVNTVAAQIMAGQADFGIGGGVESMSRIPIGADGGAWPIDPQVAWQQYFVPQGISADLVATLDGYSRETVDAFAVESQRRRGAAGRILRSLDRSGPRRHR
jgi:acetyl-CoA C-acetyltransferase